MRVRNSKIRERVGVTKMLQILQNGRIKSATGFAVGAASIAAALLLTLFFGKWVEPPIPSFFLAAIAVTAWLGGKYPSLFATFLAVVIIEYFFHPSFDMFALGVENTVNAVVFILVALLISYIDAARKSAFAERERLLTSERSARAEAENANRAKDTFLAMVTHELRLPLNAILGWTRIMQNGRLDSAQTAHALDVVERNVRIQAQLVEELIDLSRIRTGKFRINPSLIDLRGAISAAIESVKPAIEAKSIRLVRDFDEKIVLVRGDAERLQQIVWNLLSNAVKFTPEGGQISIRLERADTRVLLKIEDNGEGIRPEFLPFVFDLFRQSEENAEAKHEGLGLGLAIVRHLVEAHGGSVTAASAGKGAGATFTVELPLFSAAQIAAAGGSAKRFGAPSLETNFR